MVHCLKCHVPLVDGWSCLSLPAQTKMVEEKFSKLREVYQKLRTDHIQLLRENGETQKKLKTLDVQMEQREASAKASEEEKCECASWSLTCHLW